MLGYSTKSCIQRFVLRNRQLPREIGDSSSDIAFCGQNSKQVEVNKTHFTQFIWNSFREVENNSHLNWDVLKDIIIANSQASNSMVIVTPDDLEWTKNEIASKLTDFNISRTFHPITEEIFEFLLKEQLLDCIGWLKLAAPDFFPGANFEFDILDDEDDSNASLALRVYSSFSSNEFRDRRHKLYTAILSANYTCLYEKLSIFQRRTTGSGWQAFLSHGQILID